MTPPSIPTMHALRRHVERNHERATQRLRHLVDHDTPSFDPDATSGAITLLLEWCEAQGATVDTIDAGGAHADHLRARWPATHEPRNHLLILTHVDTVWPGDETTRRPFQHDGDRATGPGIFDMKTGIIQSLEAIDAVLALQPLEHTTLTLLVTTDEEVGSPTSRDLIEREASTADVVLVTEPSSDAALKSSRKGVGMYRVSAHGRSAHAGLEPQAGRSAILEIARQIPLIDALNDYAVGTTVTVGMIAGGSARNVVAERCHVDVDVRTMTPEETRRVHEALLNLRAMGEDVTLDVEGGTNRPVMERTEVTAQLYARAQAIADHLDEPLSETAVGGGSDGNFTAALGRPTLDGLGAVGGGAHALHEWIDVRRSLIQRTSLLAGLLLDLSATPLQESA